MSAPAVPGQCLGLIAGGRRFLAAAAGALLYGAVATSFGLWVSACMPSQISAIFGTALQLFATTSIGIFMGTLACLVPRFGLMLLPLQMLSGSITLRKSMPTWFQLALLLIGCAFLAIALLRFRRTIGAMAS